MIWTLNYLTESEFNEFEPPTQNRQRPVSIERRLKSWNIKYNFKWNQPYLSRVSNSLNSASVLPIQIVIVLISFGFRFWFFSHPYKAPEDTILTYRRSFGPTELCIQHWARFNFQCLPVCKGKTGRWWSIENPAPTSILDKNKIMITRQLCLPVFRG